MVATTIQNRQRTTQPNYDQYLLWAAIILLGIGLVMVFSASIAIADANVRQDSHHYLIRQALYIGVGLVAAISAFTFPMAWWQKMAPILFIIGIGLLVIVIIPGVGHGAKGAQRWIPLYVANLQPSEIMKLLIPLYVANFAVRKADAMNDFKRIFVPMLIVMIVIGILLLQQPDFGAFAVITATALSILWLGGISLKIFFGTMTLFSAALATFVWLEPYRLKRIKVFLEGPWEDPFGAGYQISHSFMAYGRGEWFGVGLGGSMEKLLYLPDPHTDFLLAVIAEELGFLGVLTVVGGLAFIVMRGFRIAKEALQLEKYFASLLAQGLCVWIGIQSIINIGGSMGFLPSKGITLPLLSFGGSGMLVNCVAIALLLRIDFENRRIMRGLPV